MCSRDIQNFRCRDRRVERVLGAAASSSSSMEIGWGQEKAPTKDLSKDLLSVPTAPAAERSRSKM